MFSFLCVFFLFKYFFPDASNHSAYNKIHMSHEYERDLQKTFGSSLWFLQSDTNPLFLYLLNFTSFPK